MLITDPKFITKMDVLNYRLIVSREKKAIAFQQSGFVRTSCQIIILQALQFNKPTVGKYSLKLRGTIQEFLHPMGIDSVLGNDASADQIRKNRTRGLTI